MQQGLLPFPNGSVGSRGDKDGVVLSAGGRVVLRTRLKFITTRVIRVILVSLRRKRTKTYINLYKV